MPCNSDYMNPTDREQRLQQTAKLFVYACKKLGKTVPEYATKTAKDSYANNDKSVMGLCDLLHSLSTEAFDNLVYNAKEKTSRELADWWEEHDAADKKREAKEAAEKAKLKAKADKEADPDYNIYLALKKKFE